MTRAEVALPSLPLWLATLIAVSAEAVGLAGLAHWPAGREIVPPEVPIDVSLVSAAALADSAAADAAGGPPAIAGEPEPPPPDPAPDQPEPEQPPPVKAVDPTPAPVALAPPKPKPRLKHRPKPPIPVVAKPKPMRPVPAHASRRTTRAPPSAPQGGQGSAPGSAARAGGSRSGRGGQGTGGSAPAAYLNNPAPGYPDAARRQRQQGTVHLRVLVSAGGAATDVMVAGSSGVTSLDQAAVRAVRRWRFRPARQSGQPITAWVRIPIRFALNR